MPANEGFYRNQKSLHLFFLLSSVAMLVATLWMLGKDHYRPWKQHQREFASIKQGQLYEKMLAEKSDRDLEKLRQLELTLSQREDELAEHRQQIEEKSERLKNDLQPKLVARQTELANIKAFQAEAQSKFDLLVVTMSTDENTESERYKRLQRQLERLKGTDDYKGELQRLAEDVQQATVKVEQTKAEIAATEEEIETLRMSVTELEDEIKAINADYQKAQTAWEESGIGVAEEILAAPIIDGFASPLKVKQVVLDDLPLDYNFKMVTRFDRCMTCHLGIDSPGLTKADGVKEPYCSHPHLDLYVGAKSPHPVDKFGCTICHQGQGTATEFRWASHTPDSVAERKEWRDEHDWFFNHFHELPMYPTRFVEAGCLKCHHDPYQIPQADSLLTGFKTVKTYGCFGCHEINGYKDDGRQIGPHLMLAKPDDSADKQQVAQRRVGPSLLRMAEKLDPEFVKKWLRSPTAFRPTTRMPAFYHQLDSGFFGDGPEGEFEFGEPDDKLKHDHQLSDLAEIEIHAIAAYLFDASEKYLAKDGVGKLPAVSPEGDAAKGKTLFASKGCVACHVHKAVEKDFDVSNFGPELSQIAAKFSSPKQHQWLKSWIKNPAAYNPKAYMPNLQLSDEDAADIAAYLISIPGKWARDVSLTPLEELIEKGPEGQIVKSPLRDLVFSIVRKAKSLDETIDAVNAMDQTEQLLFLGEKTVGRLGCFGCHNIEGFEGMKPIGTALTDWGKKDPHKLAFENIHEYVDEQVHEGQEDHFYEENDYYLDALGHHQREGFLMQKLREPRSYDFKKIRRWEDRTRMPRFNFTNQQRESVATFVVGLVAEEIKPAYVYNPAPEKKAQIRGRRLLDKYNCVSCHVVEPGKYRFTPNPDYADLLVQIGESELEKDFVFKGHPAWDVPKDEINQGSELVVPGLYDGAETAETAEDPENIRIFVRSYLATSLKGQVVPAGTKFAIPQTEVTPSTHTPPYGGKFALQLVEYNLNQLLASGKPAGPSERDKAWATVPPPLLHEGEKVQTPWLYRFLRDPVSIRPAAQLRMPKFNYRTGDVEGLADFFAAHDNQPYPYVQIPERDSDYISQMNVHHPDYLGGALKLITHKDLCVKCHPIAGYKPTGKPEELGPPLTRAPDRLRPEWMQMWISNPKRLVPYTGMPLNFPKGKEQFQDLFKGTSADHIKAARDALINYDRVVEMLIPEQKQEQPQAAASLPKENVQ